MEQLQQKQQPDRKERERVLKIIFNQIETNDDCEQCGLCCNGFFYLSATEASIILQYVIQNKTQPLNHGLNFCPFLDVSPEIRKPRCRIYEVRPYTCRSFRCNTDIQLTEAHRMYLEIFRPSAQKIGFYLDPLVRINPVFVRCESHGFDWQEIKSASMYIKRRPDVLGCIKNALYNFKEIDL